MDSRIQSKVLLVVKVPDKLQRWWNMLGPLDKLILGGRLGSLPNLLDITPHPDLIEALLTYWDPQGMVFRFGHCELTPTLSEIAGLSYLKYLGKELIIPRNHTCKRLLKDLGLKHNKKLMCFKENRKAKYPRENLERMFPKGSWITLDYLFERFGPSTGFKDFRDEFSTSHDGWSNYRLQAFSIALLGCLVFPMDDGRISTRLGSVVNALFDENVRKKVTLVPMILAELYRALNGIQSGMRFFEGCNLLLQLWMIEHMHPHTLIPHVDTDVRNRVSCIEYRSSREKYACPVGVEDWIRFLDSLTHERIQWTNIWLRCDEILVRSFFHPFLVLIGLWCIRPYSPVRVLRQLSRKQGIPVVPDVREYILDFDEKIPKEDMILTFWENGERLNKETIAENRYMPGCTSEYLIWIQSIERGLVDLWYRALEGCLARKMVLGPWSDSLLIAYARWGIHIHLRGLQ